MRQSMEVRTEQRVLEVKLYCKCGGNMLPQKHPSMTHYKYKCIDCGIEIVTDKQYPYIEFEPMDMI